MFDDSTPIGDVGLQNRIAHLLIGAGLVTAGQVRRVQTRTLYGSLNGIGKIFAARIRDKIPFELRHGELAACHAYPNEWIFPTYIPPFPPQPEASNLEEAKRRDADSPWRRGDRPEPKKLPTYQEWLKSRENPKA